MEKCLQFSLFLANKPGVLSQLFRGLAKAKVNITTLSVMDSSEHGVIRMIVDSAADTRKVLKKLNFPVQETDVISVTLSNKPGAAADLCDKLSAAHIDVAYMYCAGGSARGRTVVVIKVPDIRKAMKVLENNNNKSTRRDMKIKLRRPKTPARRR